MMTESTPSAYAKSVLHWLTLAGVSVDIAETPREWLQPAAKDILFQSSEPVKNEAKTVASAPAASIQFDNFNNINELNTFLQQWKGLGITKTASHTVLGEGSSEPCLMVICDTPDTVEDQQGRAFIGKGNLFLLEALAAAGFVSDTLYKTYVSKWRPAGQKLLAPNEISVLSALLHQEIVLVKPKAILAIGESSLKALGLDSLRNTASTGQESIYKNQLLNYEIPVFSSQKGEFLVKTAGMKKSFWLGLVRFVSTLRAKGVITSALGSPSVNCTE